MNVLNIRLDTPEMISTYPEGRAEEIIQNISLRIAEMEKSEREVKKHNVYNGNTECI